MRQRYTPPPSFFQCSSALPLPLLCQLYSRCHLFALSQEEQYEGSIEAIAHALESWATSVKQGTYPLNEDAPVTYLKYIRDIAQYEEQCALFCVQAREEAERMVEEGMEYWKAKNTVKWEAALWDWCPL